MNDLKSSVVQIMNNRDILRSLQWNQIPKQLISFILID
jgi:hypothetical protein